MTSKSSVRNHRRHYRYDYTYYNATANPPETGGGLGIEYDVEFSDFEFFEGTDNTKWRSLIRNGYMATNPASGTRLVMKAEPGSGYSSSKTFGLVGSDPDSVSYQLLTELRYDWSGQVLVPYNPGLATGSEDAVNRAKADFVSDARSLMTPTQMGVILGEIRETIHTIRHPAEALRSSMSGYLSAVKKQSRGLRKASIKKKNAVVANTWLEYTFGWKPLIQDIENAKDSLTRVLQKDPPRPYVRGFGKEELFVEEYSVMSSAAPGHSFQVSWTVKDKVTCNVYGQLATSVSQPPTFRSAFGLRPHDIVPTIWELIPYSFVADYFTNIGDVLSAATFCTSYLSWWGMSTKRQRKVNSHSPYTLFPSVGSADTGSMSTCGGSIGSAEARREDFERSTNVDLVPGLQFHLPGVSKPYVNLAALFSQARSIRL